MIFAGSILKGGLQMTPAKTATKNAAIQIQAPNFQTASFELIGTAPLVVERFSQKAKTMMRNGMEEGQKGKKGKTKEPRDFSTEFPASMYILPDGTPGMNAAAFRNAMIRACAAAAFKMTLAKMSIFVIADGLDKFDGTPLVRIQGEPEAYEAMVRLPNGAADIRVRAMWREWTISLNVRWDADQFNIADVSNLLTRAGYQVGIGAGRPFSKNSAGIGFGTFALKG
jgi:hypothetical protein